MRNGNKSCLALYAMNNIVMKSQIPQLLWLLCKFYVILNIHLLTLQIIFYINYIHINYIIARLNRHTEQTCLCIAL